MVRFYDLRGGDIFLLNEETWLKLDGNVFRHTRFYPRIAGPFNAINNNGATACFEDEEITLVGNLKEMSIEWEKRRS